MSPRIFLELAEFAHYIYFAKLQREYLRVVRRNDTASFYGSYGIFLDGIQSP